MAGTGKIDIRRLASLLDDQDDAVAVSAMAELLNREEELGEIPGELQESSNPLMRRRVHQLETALTMIRRRRGLSRLLREESPDFIEGLIEIHLQWFDRDSEPALRRRVDEFRTELLRHVAPDLAGAGNAFAACGIAAFPPTTLKVELFCLGSMLDDRCGASPLWCGMLCALYPDLGLRTVRHHGRFAVISADAAMVPENNWQCGPLPPFGELEVWTGKALLRLAVMTLFSAAVNSDSFRYILTVAQSITGSENGDALTVLPYPYNPEIEPLP